LNSCIFVCTVATGYISLCIFLHLHFKLRWWGQTFTFAFGDCVAEFFASVDFNYMSAFVFTHQYFTRTHAVTVPHPPASPCRHFSRLRDVDTWYPHICDVWYVDIYIFRCIAPFYLVG